jgi:diaminopimelate epimerase
VHLPFSKYSGCGNDFIMIDDRALFFPVKEDALIQKMCHRQKGIGADGVILLQPSQAYDFKMRIFNSDGHEAEMCGNGLRCLAKYMMELEIPEKSYAIETMNQILNVAFIQEQVKTSMPAPTFLNKDFTLNIDRTDYECTYLDTGVPHLVIFVEDVEGVDVLGLGQKFRFHPFFAPRGVNVNFVEKTSENSLKIRTYERGVENETLACGTGCSAAAAVAVDKWKLGPKIYLKTHSSEILTIDLITNAQGEFTSADQTGPAVRIFQGRFELELKGNNNVSKNKTPDCRKPSDFALPQTNGSLCKIRR